MPQDYMVPRLHATCIACGERGHDWYAHRSKRSDHCCDGDVRHSRCCSFNPFLHRPEPSIALETDCDREGRAERTRRPSRSQDQRLRTWQATGEAACRCPTLSGPVRFHHRHPRRQRQRHEWPWPIVPVGPARPQFRPIRLRARVCIRLLLLTLWALTRASSKLPPPIRPSAARRSSSDDGSYGRGSLSDYSDYQSSDEETHNRASTSRGRSYGNASDNEEGYHKKPLSKQAEQEDPFADPFAD